MQRNRLNLELFSAMLALVCLSVLPLFSSLSLAADHNAPRQHASIKSADATGAVQSSGQPIGSGNGLIHVIPSLSSPSVKNGGQLKIQAVVKAVEGVERVEAVIERVGEQDAPVVARIELKPAPMNLGVVSGDVTVGLWQGEWEAHGLRDGYYTVALRITDRTGNVFTDRSLRFSDPIAGNNTPLSLIHISEPTRPY